MSELTDLLNLDAEFTEEELALRGRVREFVDRRIRPNIEQWYEEAVFPTEIIPEMAELGLLGMHIKGYGCAGRSATEYGIAMQELEAGDSGLRTFVSVQGSLAMSAIAKHGSEEQKEHWLPEMAAGRVVGCFALTEPEAGSDPAGMQTTAVRDGDGWVLNGSKRWIGLGTIAQIAIVWAKTDEGVRGFIVPTDAEGFTAKALEPKLSMRASIQTELTFDNIRLTEADRLPGATSLRAPFECLNEARYGIVWRDGRGPRRLRERRELRGRASPVQPPALVVPAHAEEAHRHGPRDRQGPAALAAHRPPQGRGQARAPHDLGGQAQQLPRRDRDLP